MSITDLRFGVIGWGYWGPKIARNLDSLPNAMVTMVADTDFHRLASPIRLGTQPRAHGGVGLAVVEVLAAAQEALEKQLTNSKQGVK